MLLFEHAVALLAIIFIFFAVIAVVLPTQPNNTLGKNKTYLIGTGHLCVVTATLWLLAPLPFFSEVSGNIFVLMFSTSILFWYLAYLFHSQAHGLK